MSKGLRGEASAVNNNKNIELFFISSPIGGLTGLIKENKLYSLSGSSQWLKTFKISLKTLDVKKTYLFDSEIDSEKQKFLKQSSASPLVKKIKKELGLYFKGKLKSFNIPLYNSGTPFQQKVWRTLRNIPYGQTKTYSEIAYLVKKPKAYRAIGTCCAKNPLLIVTPCHRVLSQKSLGGFMLGLKVKKQLLNRERKPTR